MLVRAAISLALGFLVCIGTPNLPRCCSSAGDRSCSYTCNNVSEHMKWVLEPDVRTMASPLCSELKDTISSGFMAPSGTVNAIGPQDPSDHELVNT